MFVRVSNKIRDTPTLWWPKYMEVEEEIDMFCEHGKLVVKSSTKDRIFKITTNLEHFPHDNRV